MRTNIVLKEYVDNHKRRSLCDLKGMIDFFEGYDYKKMREGE